MRTWISLGVVLAGLGLGCGDSTSMGGGGAGGEGTGGTGAGNGGGHTGGGGEALGGGGAGGEGGTGGSGPQALTIPFEARVGAEPAACGTTYSGLGVEPADVKLNDLRFYVHDIRLVDGDGNEVPVELDQDGIWQFETVALLDFEDGTDACSGGTAETNTSVVGTVPAGDYEAIRFRVGVPFELNHEDVATSPSPLNITTLFWTWGFGHLFFAAVTEATPVDGGESNQHFVHLGSTGCTGDPELGEVVDCTSPNRPEYELTSYVVGTSKIILDLEPLLADSKLLTELGCHSFPDTPECETPFSALGIDYATGELTSTQSVFTVE